MPYNTTLLQKESSKKQWWKLIIWALVLIPAIGFWYNSYSYSQDLEEKISFPSPITIEVQKGELNSTLAKRLEEKKIIVSAESFLKYLKKNEVGKKIKFGDHTISGSLGIAQVAQILSQKADVKSIKITIPEGLTLAEIDTRLGEKNIFTAKIFSDCIEKTCDFSEYYFLPSDRTKWEGYFFPATYTIETKKLSPQVLGEKMLSALDGRIQKYNLSEYKKYSLQDVLTMASIIEKESSGKDFNENEAAMISGILWNRIEQGIPLGADATIRYGLSKNSSALTKKELATDNPFNTRKHKGFPPFAISAPGDISLQAAVNPAQTDMLFYLHDKSQKIHYATTNAGHEANKSKYCGESCE